MAKTDTAAAVAAAAAKVKTVGQARAALGVVADVCHQAYGVAGRIDSVLSNGTGRDDDAVRSAAIDRVDVVNNFAQKVYATLPTDDASQSQPVSVLTASKVGLVLGQAQRAFRDVEDALVETQWSFVDLLTQSIAAAGELAGHAVQAVTNAAAGGLFAFLRAAWPTILIVLALVLGAFWLRGRVLRRVAT